MNEINLLTKKRENLLIQISVITLDLKEYIKYPVETVDVVQLKYEYSFCLFEIKQIDDKIKQILLSSNHSVNNELSIIEKLLSKVKVIKKFTVSDLPKLHFNMFHNPDIF